ncbi:DUF1903-domain-containing protein [Meredithblackwellia eburnea MCA 4105]
MPAQSSPPCQREACAIQDCLSANEYQESRCVTALDALYTCCSKLTPGETSTACPKPEVVQRKLKEKEQRGKR